MVARPNTRGVASQQSYERYGAIQLEDTHALLDALAADSLVDVDRVAVVGHSHGGAMAYYYATHSTRFCAAVAVNGWADWSEIADRLPGDSATLDARLQAHSPLLNADAVRARVLAVAGAGDTQVQPTNAARIVDALHALGRSAELLHFEDEGHLLTDPANVRRFWEAALRTLQLGCGG